MFLLKTFFPDSYPGPNMPDPAAYDMNDPAQCRDFYESLKNEIHDMADMWSAGVGGRIGGPVGAFSGFMMADALKDMADPRFEQAINRDCADNDTGGTSDGGEAPGEDTDGTESPDDGDLDGAGAADGVVDLPPVLIGLDGGQTSPDPAGDGSADGVVDLPPVLIGLDGGQTSPDPAEDPAGDGSADGVVDLAPVVIDVGGAPPDSGYAPDGTPDADEG